MSRLVLNVVTRPQRMRGDCRLNHWMTVESNEESKEEQNPQWLLLLESEFPELSRDSLWKFVLLGLGLILPVDLLVEYFACMTVKFI